MCAKFNSRVSVFNITDVGAQSRDMSAYLTEISGLPGERELNDATTLGDAGRDRHPSLENGIIRLAGFFDDASSSGPDDVFGGLYNHTAATAFDYGPKGSGGSPVKYSGTCWVRRYEITSRVGELVGFTVEIEVEGQIAKGTY